MSSNAAILRQFDSSSLSDEVSRWTLRFHSNALENKMTMFMFSRVGRQNIIVSMVGVVLLVLFSINNLATSFSAQDSPNNAAGDNNYNPGSSSNPSSSSLAASGYLQFRDRSLGLLDAALAVAISATVLIFLCYVKKRPSDSTSTSSDGRQQHSSSSSSRHDGQDGNGLKRETDESSNLKSAQDHGRVEVTPETNVTVCNSTNNGDSDDHNEKILVETDAASGRRNNLNIIKESTDSRPAAAATNSDARNHDAGNQQQQKTKRKARIMRFLGLDIIINPRTAMAHQYFGLTIVALVVLTLLAVVSFIYAWDCVQTNQPVIFRDFYTLTNASYDVAILVVTRALQAPFLAVAPLLVTALIIMLATQILLDPSCLARATFWGPAASLLFSGLLATYSLAQDESEIRRLFYIKIQSRIEAHRLKLARRSPVNQDADKINVDENASDRNNNNNDNSNSNNNNNNSNLILPRSEQDDDGRAHDRFLLDKNPLRSVPKVTFATSSDGDDVLHKKRDTAPTKLDCPLNSPTHANIAIPSNQALLPSSSNPSSPHTSDFKKENQRIKEDNSSNNNKHHCQITATRMLSTDDNDDMEGKGSYKASQKIIAHSLDNSENIDASGVGTVGDERAVATLDEVIALTTINTRHHHIDEGYSFSSSPHNCAVHFEANSYAGGILLPNTTSIIPIEAGIAASVPITTTHSSIKQPCSESMEPNLVAPTSRLHENESWEQRGTHYNEKQDDFSSGDQHSRSSRNQVDANSGIHDGRMGRSKNVLRSAALELRSKLSFGSSSHSRPQSPAEDTLREAAMNDWTKKNRRDDHPHRKNDLDNDEAEGDDNASAHGTLSAPTSQIDIAIDDAREDDDDPDPIEKWFSFHPKARQFAQTFLLIEYDQRMRALQLALHNIHLQRRFALSTFLLSCRVGFNLIMNILSGVSAALIVPRAVTFLVCVTASATAYLGNVQVKSAAGVMFLMLPLTSILFGLILASDNDSTWFPFYWELLFVINVMSITLRPKFHHMFAASLITVALATVLLVIWIYFTAALFLWAFAIMCTVAFHKQEAWRRERMTCIIDQIEFRRKEQDT